jgi:hypothetical protein
VTLIANAKTIVKAPKVLKMAKTMETTMEMKMETTMEMMMPTAMVTVTIKLGPRGRT